MLLYCLVIKNASFRKYCQRNADKASLRFTPNVFDGFLTLTARGAGCTSHQINDLPAAAVENSIFSGRNSEVLPALLEVLNSVSTTENKILAKAPAGVMAMLLVILALTGAGSEKKRAATSMISMMSMILNVESS